MRVFCLCVYSFLICWFPLGVFGPHFAFLGATLGLILTAWARGLSLASLWPLFGSLGTPWSHLRHLGLPRGAWDDFWSKMEVQFRANRSQVARLRTKKDLAELSGVSELSELSALWAQSAADAAAPNPTLLAPEARMTVI